MTEKELSKYEKEFHDDLDYIPESRHYSAPHCEYCNEILDLSTGALNENGDYVVTCYNCGYLNIMK